MLYRELAAVSTLSPVCPSRLSVSPLRTRARVSFSFLWLQSNAVLGALDSYAASRDLVSPGELSRRPVLRRELGVMVWYDMISVGG